MERISVKTIRYIIEAIIKNSKRQLSIKDTAVTCLNEIYTNPQYWLECNCENVRDDIFYEIENMINENKLYLNGLYLKLNNESI